MSLLHGFLEQLVSPLIISTVFLACVLYVGIIIIRRIVNKLRINAHLLKHFPTTERRHWLYGSIRKEFKGLGHVFYEACHERMLRFRYAGVIWFGYFNPVLVLCHPETAKEVLRCSDPKSYLYRQSLMTWLGEGLLISSGKKWARSRRLLTPAFHFDVLKPYTSVYNEAAEQFMVKLEGLDAGKSGFELFHHTSLMTLDTILRCAFTYETNCQMLGSSNAYINAVYELSNLWTLSAQLQFAMFPWAFKLTENGRRFQELSNFVHREAKAVIKSRRQVLEEGGVEQLLGDRKYLDFLDILLTAKDDTNQGMSDEDIRAEVDTFLFEGHDTTTSGISWTLYLLATNPESQARAQEEVDDIMTGKHDPQIDWSDMSKLEYVSACIKEAMRMYCPVPIIGRCLTESVELRGCQLPAEQEVRVDIHAIHHNPLVWGDDHMEYKPERFLPENSKGRHPYAFLPFSAGPRNCIGQVFAMSEMKVIITRLLHRYTFHAADDCPKPLPRMRIITRTEEELKLLAVPRPH